MTLKDDKIRAAQALLTEALALTETAAPARVIPVTAGQNLQAAIDTAQPGAVIETEAGATFTGPFRLHGGNSEAVVIRSAGSYARERVTPLLASAFTKVRPGAGGLPAFYTDPGAQGWVLNCLEVPANAGGFNDLIRLGDGSTAQNKDDGSIPERFVLDRLYLHGHMVDGQKRGVALNCRSALVLGCHMSGFFVVGQDSQAIDMWNGPGDYQIVDNFLEAASENVLVGGTDAAVPDLVPTDIQIEGNTISKPASWRGKRYNVKTLFELKNARNVTFRKNLVSGVWADAQIGYAVQLTPRNQDGAAPWSTVEDVTIEDNDFDTMSAAINFLGTDYGNPSGRMKRVSVLSNRFTGIDPALYGGSDKVFQVLDGPEDLTLDRNVIKGANIGSVLYFAGGKPALRMQFTNNRYPASTYGIFGASASVGGNPPHAWVTYTEDGVFEGNAIV